VTPTREYCVIPCSWIWTRVSRTGSSVRPRRNPFVLLELPRRATLAEPTDRYGLPSAPVLSGWSPDRLSPAVEAETPEPRLRAAKRL
jgi:hypothetical protein